MPSCEDCGKHFSNPKMLEKHYDMEHGGDKESGKSTVHETEGEHIKDHPAVAHHVMADGKGSYNHTFHHGDGSVTHHGPHDLNTVQKMGKEAFKEDSMERDQDFSEEPEGETEDEQ